MVKKWITGVLMALFALLALPAHAWTVDDCKKVNYNHPDCDKYPRPTPPAASAPSVNIDIGVGPVTAGSTSAADAAAKAAAEAAAKAILDAIMTATAQGGAADAKAISENWNKLTTDQKNQVVSRLSQDQVAKLNAALDNTNNIDINNSSSGGSASAGGANVSTNNIVKYGVAQIPAVVGLPSGVTTSGEIRTTITQCSLVRQEIVQVRKIDAHGIGLFTETTWHNGDILTLKPVLGADGNPLPPRYSNWEEEGLDDHGNTIIRRVGYGQQFQIDAYIVGTAMNSGLSIAGSNGSGGATAGLARGSNISTYGNFIIPHECQIVERKIGTRRIASSLPAAHSGAAAGANLELQRGRALAPTGKEVLVKKRNLCNGKPIPDGYECGFKRDTLDVVIDGRMGARAKSEAAIK